MAFRTIGWTAGVLALALGAAGAADAASPKAQVHAWRLAHEKEIVADFSTLLAMPNVATTLADVDANAAYISGLLQKRGFTTELLRAEPGTPASILAELKTPGVKRTVVFYAHYDGQPISQKGWISTPFTPSMRTAANPRPAWSSTPPRLSTSMSPAATLSAIACASLQVT